MMIQEQHFTYSAIQYSEILLRKSTKMVYYFSSNTVSPSAFIYVGKDKVESMMHWFPICTSANYFNNDNNNNNKVGAKTGAHH